MALAPDDLAASLRSAFGDTLAEVVVALGEVTAVVPHGALAATMRRLRDEPSFRFETLIDVCGVDYSTYGNAPREGPRYAAVYHLLSLANNAHWFERQAFDLYGLISVGHPDLRRLLTDYGFVGHPFRKDFPLSGHVEMRFDPEQGRVIYQPVTIEPREVTPRVIRERNYADNE